MTRNPSHLAGAELSAPRLPSQPVLSPPQWLTSRRQWSSVLDKTFDRLLFFFLFITIFLPGGSIYGFNFKYPIYALLLPLAVYSMFRRGLATPRYLGLLLLIPGVLSLWVAIGQLYGFDTASVFRQFTDMLLTFMLCWLISMFCLHNKARELRFLRLLVNASVATAALKLGLIAYSVLRGIPVVQMVTWLDTVFGVDLMTMDLGALFGRVQFMADELIPLSIYVLLRHRDLLRIGALRASLSILLLTVSVIFSFSRYFWAFAAIAFVLGLLLGKRDRFQAVLFAVLGVAILASLPLLISVYQLRFSSDVAGGSDEQRAEQIRPLKALFWDAPFFGHGVGSYNTMLLRSDALATRYSYEVQLLALPAQLGMVGIALLLALGAFYYRKLWWHSTLRLPDRLGLLALGAFWVAAGATNPLLFHPVAGVNYAAIAALAGIGTTSSSRLRLPAKTS